MKLKRTVTSKPFIAGALAVLCVGILAVCLIPRGTEKTEFVPEPTPTITQSESWNEDTTVKESTKAPTEAAGTDSITKAASKEEYPKTVESDERQTVVEFTDPSPEKPVTPAAPEGKTEVEESSPHKVEKDPTVTPPKQETAKSNTPVAGSKNEKGQVYDPAFGWISVPEGTSTATDNDGDVEKQIGSMGD